MAGSQTRASRKREITPGQRAIARRSLRKTLPSFLQLFHHSDQHEHLVVRHTAMHIVGVGWSGSMDTKRAAGGPAALQMCFWVTR
jgi:hypothetical protein